MFNNLGDRFKDIFKKVRGRGKLTESNMKDALREVRLALLEADVNYGVAKNFVSRIREKALGEEVISGVNPTQQFVKIVNDELVKVLGGTNVALKKAEKGMTIIMLCGLQGAGKTTFSGKISKFLKSKVDFDLSTVYRALEFLEKNNYIFSFDFENEKYYFKEENANFFICDSCKHIETVPEFSNKETEKEKSELKKRGFSLLSHLSIFKGKCNDCD